MLDPVEFFENQFTPVEGGYLFYASRKAGGKVVTPDEFERLSADWRRVAGRRGQLKGAGLVFLAIALWMITSRTLALPEVADTFVTAGIAAATIGRFMWAGFAPARLVRARVAVTPPRPSSQARHEARKVMTWPFVVSIILASAVTFFGNLLAPAPAVSWWAWQIGSGLMLGSYLWIAIQKLRDARRR